MPGTPTCRGEILTRDLRLVAATRPLLEADLRALTDPCPTELPGLDQLIGAERPSQWPPELFEVDDIERMLAIADNPGAEDWGLWYMVTRNPLRPGSDRALLVGIAGFNGPPDARGDVMIGYSVVAEARRRGFASQAATALVEQAFRDPRVRSVSAETFETLAGSIAVLDRCGFSRSRDEATTPGAIRFVCRRANR